MRICANAILALLWSSGLNPTWHLASNNKFSCREPSSVGGPLMVFIALLLNDSSIVWGALVPTGVNQELVQLGERRHIHARHACGHPRADHRVEHPGSHANNNARRSLDLDKPTSRSFLDAANANPATKIGVPTVMNFQLLSDMGRMNG
jgi:hypothetical protein